MLTFKGCAPHQRNFQTTHTTPTKNTHRQNTYTQHTHLMLHGNHLSRTLAEPAKTIIPIHTHFDTPKPVPPPSLTFWRRDRSKNPPVPPLKFNNKHWIKQSRSFQYSLHMGPMKDRPSYLKQIPGRGLKEMLHAPSNIYASNSSSLNKKTGNFHSLYNNKLNTHHTRNALLASLSTNSRHITPLPDTTCPAVMI